MKIVFDQGVPRPLRQHLPGHEIKTSRQMGWSELENGSLLRMAEDTGFEVLITTDKRIRYQQNLKGRLLRILVLPTPQWRVVKMHTDAIIAACAAMQPGEYREVIW